MHEGNGAQGKSGKQGWSTARRCIAVAREPLNKSYGEHWLPARFGIKARLRRHAVACQEVATPSPDCAGSPAGRVLKHAPAALQPSPRTKAISFALRLASTCFRARRDPIGLAQRFLNQGGSIKVGSQIFPDFVQVQTVFSGFHGIRTL